MNTSTSSTTSTGFYNQQGMEMTKAAFYALKAALAMKQIGYYAAMRHAVKNGSTIRLFTLAVQLIVADKFDKSESIR